MVDDEAMDDESAQGDAAPTRRKRLPNLIQGASYEEVKDGLENATTRLRRVFKKQGKRFEAAHVLEAVLADFFTLSTADQDRRIGRGLRVVAVLEARPEAGPPPSRDDSPDSTAVTVENLPSVTLNRAPKVVGDDKPAGKKPRRPLRG